MAPPRSGITPKVIADRIFTYAIVGVLVAEGVVVVIAMLWGFGYLG